MNSLAITEPLFERNDRTRSISALPPFHEAIEKALEQAANVFKCANKEENEALVDALTIIEQVMKLAEQARVDAKQPILDFSRTIDAFFKELVAEVYKEKIRLGTMGGNYQTLLQQRARAEEALRLKELQEIERRKQEQLAQAKSHDEVDAIQERAHQEVQAVPAPAAPVRAHRQTVIPDIEFEIHDIDALYRAAPQCVKLEPKKLEIKALLKAGASLPGVTVREVVKVGVRLPQARMIDV